MVWIKPILGFVLPIAVIHAACFCVQEPRSGAPRLCAIEDDPPLPDFVSGDECLFCHRFETGKSWQANRHNRTIRRADAEGTHSETLRRNTTNAKLADEVDFVMGDKNRVRFLRNGNGYGRLDLLTIGLAPQRASEPARLVHDENARWDVARFAASCAGCHTTQTDSRTQSFAAISLDCYVCHGNPSLEHTKDTSRILFAREHKESPEITVSSCGQCHLRGGRSKSTGLPYPNNFISGGDLFRDFQVDFTAADDEKLNPGDRHVYHNARSVIERHSGEVTCLSCHSIHGQSTLKHRRVARSELCFVCHDRESSRWTRPAYEVHSAVCEY